jgi:uncharacterized protein (DUF2062 family)
MPRKLLRKFLPSHEAVRQYRYVAWLGPWVQHHNLWHVHRRSCAGGVAAGLFAGLIPGSNPVQFLAASLLAIGFRVNLPIAVAVTLYSNPFTIVPLYYCAFKIGQLALLQGDGDLAPVAPIFELSRLHEWIPIALHWLGSVGKPLLLGLPLLALLLAFVGYFVVDWTWRIHVRMAWRKRRRRRARVSPR